jgi:CheY-like chemotaxis protein
MTTRLEAGAHAIQIFDNRAGSYHGGGYAALGGPLRCLLVDDNDAFLEAARVLLEREGVSVVGVASSTAEALRQAYALRPDVILIDIGLGDESGLDLARLLARDDQGGGSQMILISARAEIDYTELIAESPAAGFLPKPELSARGISRILGRTP